MSEWIDLVETDQGTMRAYRAMPPSGSGPAVVVLQEIFGVNAAMRAVADDLAAAGYVAIVPDLFWRLRPGVDLDYGQEEVQQAFKLWQQFDFAQGTADVIAAVAAVRGLPECTGPVALLGFCMGGQLAVRAGTVTKPAAVVCFYGTQLGDHLDQVAALDCPTQFHFGDQDKHVPAETQARISEIAGSKPGMTMYVYPGAEHAFFNAFRPIGYDAAAHDAAWARVAELFNQSFAGENA